MEFNFIRHRVNNGYMSIIDPCSKPRVLCFKHKTSAKVCMNHMATFKAKHGMWPSVDLSQHSIEIVNKEVKHNKSTVEEIESELDIDTLDIHELNEIGSTTNISFLYCHKYGTLMDGMYISLSGQEIDPEIDHVLYTERLDLYI